MMMHEAHEDESPTGRSGSPRLLPMAGVAAATVAILAHLGGGAMLLHLGHGAGPASLGLDIGKLGGGALVLGLVAVITLKLLMVFGARRWFRHR